MMLCSFVVWMD